MSETERSDNSLPDTAKRSSADLPFMDSDDAFAKKKPVNLYLSIALMALALFASVSVTNHYYKKINEKERLSWESGRLKKLREDKLRKTPNDGLKPLRNNWRSFISAVIESDSKNKGRVYVTVINSGTKPIDEVKTVLYRLNENAEVSSTEFLRVKNLKANQLKRLLVTSETDPNMVTVGIRAIHAPSFNFCYDSEIVTDGKSDPYYCSSN